MPAPCGEGEAARVGRCGAALGARIEKSDLKTRNAVGKRQRQRDAGIGGADDGDIRGRAGAGAHDTSPPSARGITCLGTAAGAGDWAGLMSSRKRLVMG